MVRNRMPGGVGDGGGDPAVYPIVTSKRKEIKKFPIARFSTLWYF